MTRIFLILTSGAFAIAGFIIALRFVMQGAYEDAAIVFIFCGACSGFFSAEVIQ